MQDAEKPSLFELRSASLRIGARRVLSDLDVVIASGCVTAILGPGGAGKSSLIRALSGCELPADWRLEGSWKSEGVEFAQAERRDLRLAWVKQRTHSWTRREDPTPPKELTWEEALGSGAAVVLLDEPTLPAGSVERRRAAEMSKERSAAGRSTLLVTHDLSLATAMADAVVLLCDGRVDVATPAEAFFAAPPTALAAQFVREGNCCPRRAAPPLPPHFRWLLPGKLAGMGRPGFTGSRERDIEALAEAGVTVLVSLTDEPPPAALLAEVGIASLHLPIPDMGAPAIAPAARVCRELERRLRAGGAGTIHCHAGLGRTGTMLAAYLVWTGTAPDEAIVRVRTVSELYIQTRGQEQFVRRFAAEVAPVTPGVPNPATV